MKFDSQARKIWQLLTGVPSVGVSVVDAQGGLLFVNEGTMTLFEGHVGVDYHGKTIADFHPPEFVTERLSAIGKVLETNQPLMMTHIYLGRRLQSLLYPMRSRETPRKRVLVVTQQASEASPSSELPEYETGLIDLGVLNVLTPRELEILVLLGHGMTVPQAAKHLHRSPKTIERHKSAISKKLHIHSQAALARLVALVGLRVEDIEKQRLTEAPVEKTLPGVAEFD